MSAFISRSKYKPIVKATMNELAMKKENKTIKDARNAYINVLKEAIKEGRIEYRVKDAPNSVWTLMTSSDAIDIINEEYRVA